MITADYSCRLLEVDFSGIEAVQVGWWCRDPEYIRLASLGIHAALASHVLGKPYDPRWSDADLLAYFTEIKAQHPETYVKTKPVTHGVAYGRTPHGIHQGDPESFPTLASAKKIFQTFYQMAPKVPLWQSAVRQRAHEYGFLGGSGEIHRHPERFQTAHPYGYTHYFWSIFAYRPTSIGAYVKDQARLQQHGGVASIIEMRGKYYRIDLGEDGKRCVAFFPQSTAGGNLKESMLTLFTPGSDHYIGDAYFGRTPLRAPIHDSLLLEVPVRAWDRVLERVVSVMQRPIAAQPLPEAWGMGAYLQIGVEAKASGIGGSWADTCLMDIGGMPTLAAEADWTAPLEEDLEDVMDLEVVA